MKIIIAEKVIAGRRIAEILAGRKIPQSEQLGAKLFEYKRNGENYEIIPLSGHIVDVDFPFQYKQWLGTDIKKLTMAEIEYIGKQLTIIRLLKQKAKQADEVIIATDADREGEAIGLEALNYIKEVNPQIKVKRAYFSAITPKDIENAFNNLTELDYNFAESANARREIDLIWGAVLTRFLSLISGRLGKDFISSGRVQTPTLKILVDREKERLAFKKEKYWLLNALFEKDKQQFEALHKKGKFWKKNEAEKVFSKKTDKGIVVKIKSSKKILKKPSPFSTTSFLRAASGIGFTAGQAMQIAESLYTKGFISYPRTDNETYPKNLNLNSILDKLKEVTEFRESIDSVLSLGKLNPSSGKETKDHPPIHPVEVPNRSKIGEREWKIYELVCRRFFATLHEDSKTKNLSVDIDLNKELFVANGQTIINAGWKSVYPYSKLEEKLLPELKEKDEVKLIDLKMEEKETQPPNRYSQGTLIKLMSEKNLGTKSTRHEIIQKLYNRKYISGLKSLEPNKIAFAVIDSLEKHKSEIVEAKMTAFIEKEMDKIASSKKTKEEVVKESREILLKELNKLIAEKDNIGSELRKAFREDSMLVPCWICDNGTMRLLRGRTGKRFLGCTNYPNCNSSFPLPQNGNIIPTEKECEFCKRPIIKIQAKRRSYEMCLNYDCESKKDWKKYDKTKKDKTDNKKDSKEKNKEKKSE